MRAKDTSEVTYKYYPSPFSANPSSSGPLYPFPLVNFIPLHIRSFHQGGRQSCVP